MVGMNPMQMMNMLRGKNPDQMMNMILQQNPMARTTLSQMQTMAKSNGMTGEQFAKQLAGQNGMNERDLIGMVNMLQGR